MVGVGTHQSVVISCSANYFYLLYVSYTNEPFSCGWQEDEHGEVTGCNFCIKAKLVGREGGKHPSVTTSLLRSANLPMFHR